MILIGVWPILDDDVTTADVVAEALAELPALAASLGAYVAGSASWRVTPGDVAGYPSPTGLYLMLEVDAL